MPRWAYVVSKQRKAALIKTIEVIDTGFSKKQFEEIKEFSASKYGRLYKEIKKEIEERFDYSNNDNTMVKDWEPLKKPDKTDFLVLPPRGRFN